MDGDQLVIDLGVRLVDFQKSMSDATSSASAALSKIEARGAEAAKKLDAGFAGVGKNAAMQTLTKDFTKAEVGAGSLVTRLKQVNDALNATKASAASGFASGQAATIGSLAQQVGAAGSLKNFIGVSGGALGVGAIAAGVVAEQTKALADLQELADRARVTAAQMAGLEHVFGKLGLTSDTTGKMMETFADRLQDAKVNGGALASALSAAGISFQNADGSVRPAIEVFSDLVRHMRSSTDEAGKLQLATAAVGDQFAGPFVNAVKSGGSALDNLQAATHRVGSAITNDLARMAESGVKSLDALWDHMNRVYSRMKEIAGFSLTAQDQINVAEQHVREAQGNITQLQLASNFRDVDPSEMKAAYQRLFDAGAELSAKSPVRVLSGTSPGEIAAPAPAAPTAPATPDDDDASSKKTGRARASHKDSDKDDKSSEVIEKLRLELQLAQSTGDAHQKIVDQLKIEEKLKEAGVTASSAEGKTIADLVKQTDAATEAEKQHEKALEASKKAADAIGQALEGSIESIIFDSKRLSSVFKSLATDLEKMALKSALTGDGPFGGLFGTRTKTATGGLFGSLFGAATSAAPSIGLSGLSSSAGSFFGSIGHLLGFASGGVIKGEGSGTSDSILARVSSGEFVVNADAAQKNLGLLHALNGTGPVPRFASGGQVGATFAPSFGGSSGGGHSFNISAPVTVNGNGGDSKQNQDLADKMHAQLTDAINKQVVAQITQQLRPGNMLQNVQR